MITLLIIFSCACIAMCAMISIKVYELKTGNEFIFIRWRKNIDQVSHSWFSKLKNFVTLKERDFIAFTKKIPVHILKIVSNLHDYLYRRYGKHVDMIKGRNIPTNKGSVSFFVSAISEYKNEINEGVKRF